MNTTEKKQSYSFSYMDIFFLLLAGLILSFGIGFLIETHRESMGEKYLVDLSASVGEELKHAVPAKGDVLFDEDGRTCGKVLSVETVEKGNRLILKLHCRLEGENPKTGETITVETVGSIRQMQVDAVIPENAEKKGK
ncbi:MAG: hypothetical protein E7580_05790 [Ruminococcaceae bacterium]|nr:hypothetical protein [Oscillospiraceae bacterium]